MRDKTYNPKKRITGQTRHSTRIQQVGQINYSEIDPVESDSEGEFQVDNSESGFGSVKDKVESEAGIGDDNWTPRIFTNTATQVGLQFAKLAEEHRQSKMVREEEKTSIEKMMDLMLTMRMEDQKRDREREQLREER